jgi:hypothetical protein
VAAALADQPELRQSTEQWRADLRALANEPERLGSRNRSARASTSWT